SIPTDVLSLPSLPPTSQSQFHAFCPWLTSRTCPCIPSNQRSPDNRHNRTPRTKKYRTTRPKLDPPRSLQQTISDLSSHGFCPGSRDLGRFPHQHHIHRLRRTHDCHPSTRHRYIFSLTDSSRTNWCRTC